MKKNFSQIILTILLMSIYSCVGYEPIYTSSKVDIKIANYSIEGDKKLGKKIYSKLLNLSNSVTHTEKTKNVSILIRIEKNKKVTNKDVGGNILGYRLNLNTYILLKDFSSGSAILNENISLSSTYTVQDQFAETKKLEDQNINNLLNSTYEEILSKLSKNIL